MFSPKRMKGSRSKGSPLIMTSMRQQLHSNLTRVKPYLTTPLPVHGGQNE
jgi:hypothetical protein